MINNLPEKFGQAREIFSAMPATRKILVLAGVAAVLAGFIFLLVWTNQTDYSIMYSGLTQEDAGQIVDRLNKRKVPYILTEDGSTIEVPKSVIQETRLYLATEGLPQGGSVGMEMFSETHLGETDFVQRLNFQRALQGELERTIKKFDAIENVRVHLNIPKESLFIEEERVPSASVVISLNRGKSLTAAQLQGVVHLVSSSVEGLTADNISVVDTSGGLLYSKSQELEGSNLTSAQIQYRENLEQTLSHRVTGLLERIVGPDKAMARITASLDFQQISTNEEIYDPDRSVIRSEQRLTEKNTGGPKGASGIPQSTFELGTGQTQTSTTTGQGEEYQRTEETTNYEITKINRQIQSAAGEIKRLTIAVMVDGTYEETTQDGKTVSTYVPRPQSELDKLTELVKNTIGYDEARGDSVVVSSVQFYLPEEPPGTWWATPLDYLRQYGRTMFNILLIVIFFLFVVRPMVAWLQKQASAQPRALEGPVVALPEGEERQALPDYKKSEPGQLSREQVLQLARQDPERTINLLRSWIDER
jgi:flagellar M-ring protein FliF